MASALDDFRCGRRQGWTAVEAGVGLLLIQGMDDIGTNE